MAPVVVVDFMGFIHMRYDMTIKWTIHVILVEYIYIYICIIHIYIYIYTRNINGILIACNHGLMLLNPTSWKYHPIRWDGFIIPETVSSNMGFVGMAGA